MYLSPLYILLNITSHEPRELDGLLARGDGLAGQLEDLALKGSRNVVPEAFPHLKAKLLQCIQGGTRT